MTRLLVGCLAVVLSGCGEEPRIDIGGPAPTDSSGGEATSKGVPTQAEADREADAAIDPSNADEEFLRLKAEIESDR